MSISSGQGLTVPVLVKMTPNAMRCFDASLSLAINSSLTSLREFLKLLHLGLGSQLRQNQPTAPPPAGSGQHGRLKRRDGDHAASYCISLLHSVRDRRRAPLEFRVTNRPAPQGNEPEESVTSEDRSPSRRFSNPRTDEEIMRGGEQSSPAV